MDFGQRNKVETSANMSSMTDLVFLLLIFFILLSTQVVNGEKVDLPSTKSTETTAGSSVTLTITEAGVYQVNGTNIAKEDVEMRMKALFLDVKDEDKRVVLNVDKNVPTGDTIEMLGMAKQNKWKVVVATKKKR